MHMPAVYLWSIFISLISKVIHHWYDWWMLRYPVPFGPILTGVEYGTLTRNKDNWTDLLNSSRKRIFPNFSYVIDILFTGWSDSFIFCFLTCLSSSSSDSCAGLNNRLNLNCCIAAENGGRFCQCFQFWLNRLCKFWILKRFVICKICTFGQFKYLLE